MTEPSTLQRGEDPTKNAEVTGLQTAQIGSVDRIVSVQTGNIRNRLSRLRNGHDTGRVGDMFNFAVASLGSGATTSGPGQRAERFSSRTWSMWGESMVSVGSDHDGGNNDHTTYGVTIGLDRYFAQCFALGVMLGYAHDKTDVGKDGSKSTGNASTAAL